MVKEEVELPFKHKSREEGWRHAFTGVVEKEVKGYYDLVIPKEQFFLQFVRFAAGKGPKDYIEFYREIDKVLKQKGDRKTRHEMGIHEIASFITLGRYDMVVLWEAPDMATFNKFMAAWPNPNGFGSSETSASTTLLRHETG